MTALFSLAARIYLCSLVPNYNPNEPTTVNLIARFADVLDLIPSGPDGYDRSLVWPILICGSFSTPTSSFRAVFKNRIELLGEHAEFGSFGRMVRVLCEVWRISESTPAPATPEVLPFLPTPVSATTTPGGSRIKSEEELKQQQQQQYLQQQQPEQKSVHWRDVMQQNGWDFLLI
jgi:hypothetical protein